MPATITIVNLSCVIQPQSIDTVLHNFASLLDERDQKNRVCCPILLGHQINYFYVKYLLWKHTETLINPYKLGGITTEEFIEGLFHLFNPINEDNEAAHLNVISRESLTNIWNSMIVWDESAAARLDKLLDNRIEGDMVVFISNTNELHALKNIELFTTHYSPSPNVTLINASPSPSFPFFKSAEKMDERLLPIHTMQGVYLAASYKFGTFKAVEDKKQQNISTPTLIRYLIELLPTSLSPRNIIIVSNYPKDLAEAMRHNKILANNCYSSDGYFKEHLGLQGIVWVAWLKIVRYGIKLLHKMKSQSCKMSPCLPNYLV